MEYDIHDLRSTRDATMIGKLVTHGDDLALVLDRSLLDELRIDKDTPLAISTESGALNISPVRDKERRKRFEEALACTNRRYGNALRRLAE